MAPSIDTDRYQYSMYTGNAASETAKAAKNTSINTSSMTQSINMEDFLVLMVAQLQNQTMYDSVDNAEMLAQLAQYSSIQAMTEMAESMTSVVEATNESLLMNYTSYAASLVGKEVTAAEADESGNLTETTGTVTGVGLFEGNPVVYVNGKTFDLGNIMIIGQGPASSTPEVPETETPEPEIGTDNVENNTGNEPVEDTTSSEAPEGTTPVEGTETPENTEVSDTTGSTESAESSQGTETPENTEVANTTGTPEESETPEGTQSPDAISSSEGIGDSNDEANANADSSVNTDTNADTGAESGIPDEGTPETEGEPTV